MTMINCSFCGCSLDFDRAHRISEYNFCAACAYGTPTEALKRRNMTAEGTTWTETQRSQNTNVTVVYARIVGTVPGEVSSAINFQRQSLSAKLMALFRSHLKSSDELFNNSVVVWTKHPQNVAALVARPSLQAAVMEIVSLRGFVKIDKNQVTAQIRFIEGESSSNDADLMPHCLVIMDNVDRFFSKLG